MKNLVTILMSTYNGAFFIKEQIDSILAQEEVDVFLIIRDDGSTDKTNEILENYTCLGNIEVIKGNNIGFVESFNSLVKKAISYNSDFYAFVDQDDIWLPNKLSKSVSYLSAKDGSKPNVYCSNSIQINAKGKEIGLYIPYRLVQTKPVLFMNGILQGCSMVFNRKALELYNMHPSPLKYHDVWMVYIANMLGSFYYTSECLFKYRIHQNNVAGKLVKPKSKGLKAFFLSCKFWFKTKDSSAHDLELFIESFGKQLTKKDYKLVSDYINYRHNFLSKIRLILNKDVRPQQEVGLKDYFVYKLHILFNKV